MAKRTHPTVGARAARPEWFVEGDDGDPIRSAVWRGRRLATGPVELADWISDGEEPVAVDEMPQSHGLHYSVSVLARTGLADLYRGEDGRWYLTRRLDFLLPVRLEGFTTDGLVLVEFNGKDGKPETLAVSWAELAPVHLPEGIVWGVDDGWGTCHADGAEVGRALRQRIAMRDDDLPRPATGGVQYVAPEEAK